ncbi:putative trichoplein keratin filament-binding protein-like [Cocos nucifera]|uniref:Putative trichoplein keratin filament-binding protein-like n=1 Tax=Cocos nucifera TaxID=13894 RepID=A0A8K0I768_COCNU|nr:putative trichoplein keratin filament-binding protein-like [Cocos nucifera]
MISEPSKRAKVDVPSSTVAADAIANVPATTTTIEVTTVIEVMAPPTFSNPSVEIQTSEPSTEREKGGGKKKKKRLTAMKMRHQLITNIKAMNHLRSKAVKTKEDHQAEINHLLEGKAKVDYTLERKMAEIESPIEVDPLPQDVSLRAYVRNPKKEVQQLKKKLGKIEDKLKKSKKNYADGAIEINCLRQSSKQFFREYTTKKNHLNEELEEIKKSASEKS